MDQNQPKVRRFELQSLLEGMLGSRNVYFQPPSNVQLKYPAIVYERDSSETVFADNIPLLRTKRWSITYISRDPDALVPDLIEALPLCSFNRYFVADNLHHNVYNLYF